RHAALQKIGQEWVWCRVLRARRDSMSKEEYIALLREHNRQRHKSVAEQVREEMIDINPDRAYENLCKLRDKSVYAPEYNGIDILEIEGRKKRYGISDDKAEHVRLIKEIVEGRRNYWPLSVRGVHYPLLNYDFIRGYYCPRKHESDYGTKRELRY